MYDFQRPPITLREYDQALSAAARRTATAEVLGIAVKRIGPPTLYGASAYGPVVRWRSPRQTLLLDRGAQGLQFSVRPTTELEAAERARFASCTHCDPASYYAGVPYLWQLYKEAVGSPPLSFPSVPPAPDWSWLQESLTALLGSWWEQVPAQLGPDDMTGFSIVPRSIDQRSLGRITVLCSEAEGVLLLVDDRAVPGGTPAAVMETRGWQVQIAGWWQRDFHDLGAEGAAAAARMAVEELRLREVPSPSAVKVVDVWCEEGGLLVLPGLAIGR
ncbi:hypothetical protein SSP35_20_01030 [Streptomyces sp. NBRC 110611]|uniref:hypothetical protein n=1 Tax=Streptomyces sp. NBRC 110611 TaxID=1621259 RepID=UPI00082EC921|nr:hypothetical protein [Streptomyces sp. NBRC 110611]GAU70607.1 hypothetical protein SSP35_20_01030 [Streptomyces sp. NBRC 110611]